MNAPSVPEKAITLTESPQGLTITCPSAPYGQSYIVAVTGEELRITWQHPAREEPQRWSRRQVMDIRTEPDSTGDGPVSYLIRIQPHPGEGKKLELPVWEKADAESICSALHQALHLPGPLARGQLAPFLERDEPPAGCAIRLEQAAGGVVLTVPPAGWSHPNVRELCWQSLFAFGTAALGGVGFHALTAFIPDSDKESPALDLIWYGIAFLWVFAFGFLGILAVYRASDRASRCLLFEVAGDVLSVQQTKRSGEQRWRWQRPEIADVRIAVAGDGFDDSICDLQIHLRGGKVVRFLAGYGDPELQWLATVLRRTLGVSGETRA